MLSERKRHPEHRDSKRWSNRGRGLRGQLLELSTDGLAPRRQCLAFFFAEWASRPGRVRFGWIAERHIDATGHRMGRKVTEEFKLTHERSGVCGEAFGDGSIGVRAIAQRTTIGLEQGCRSENAPAPRLKVFVKFAA